jgi:hypothetical protein
MRLRYARGSFLRSPLLAGVAIAVIVGAQGVAEAAFNSEMWLGSWRETSVVLKYATLWGACITAAAAAWMMAMPRRNRHTAMLPAAARSPVRIYAAPLVAVIGGSLAGYAMVFAYAARMTAGAATHGELNVWELLPAVGWTCAGFGFGVVAGRFLPAVVAPVAAAIVPYLLPAVGTAFDFSVDRTFFDDLFGLDDSTRDYMRVPTELLVGKSLLWIILGGAALAWVLRCRRQAYALAVVAGFAAAICFLVAGVRYDITQEYAVECLGSAPKVCTDRAHDHLLPQYRRLVGEQLGQLDGLSWDRYTVTQGSGLFELARHFTGTAPDAGAGQIVAEIANGYTSPAHKIDEHAFVAHFGFGLFVTPCYATLRNGSVPADAESRSTVLYYWWLTRNNLPTDGTNYTGEMNLDYALADDPSLAPRVRQFTAMSGADRAAWWQRNARSILTCASGTDR